MLDTDRIEKKVLLRAPRSRVWRALTDTREFGTWFRAELVGTFAVGETVRGHSTYPGCEHLALELRVERMDDERFFSFRWHPDEAAMKADVSPEITTLVEFTLEDVTGGTMLTVVESGFDRLPPERRAAAFRDNEKGWTEQMENIRRHVTE